VENENPIPDAWNRAVAQILREGDSDKIEWTKQAFLDWRAATLSQFRFEAYEAIAARLEIAGLIGVNVDLAEDGETYAFFFPYRGRDLYAKICLRPCKIRIKIVSTHSPRKGKRLS
jgi:hypothetical protein